MDNFEILSKMAEQNLDIKMCLTTAGGRLAGKKGEKYGIIEMVVDEKTFQIFARDAALNLKPTYHFMLIVANQDQYEKIKQGG